MKTPYILTVLLLFLIASCTKENDFSFGEMESDFVVDSVYKTSSAGLLYVELDALHNNFSLSVLADKNPEPETEIASLRWHGSITQPLDKGTYWKVIYNDSDPEEYVRNIKINWTAID